MTVEEMANNLIVDLRNARNCALEEAAKAVDETSTTDNDCGRIEIVGPQVALWRAAAAIRALKAGGV